MSYPVPDQENSQETQPLPRVVRVSVPAPQVRVEAGRSGPAHRSQSSASQSAASQSGVPQPPAPKENLADAPATVIRAGRSIAVSRYLFDTEKFCGEWRRHWIHLWVEILAVTLGTFLLGYLAGSVGLDNDTLLGVFFVAWLALLFWAGWRVADWWYDRFVLTNRRVMVVSGLITRKVAMMPLQRVTDMAYVQGALGRVLDFGTFVLESAGQDQALREIKHLPRPNDLYLRMCEEMYDVEDEKRPASGQDSTEAD